jgi:2,4-dienoyl-CoA reductase-like NADH-dependent reductase (Old Yellow Enzyme family)
VEKNVISVSEKVEHDVFESGPMGNMHLKNRGVMAPMNIPGLVESDGGVS